MVAIDSLGVTLAGAPPVRFGRRRAVLDHICPAGFVVHGETLGTSTGEKPPLLNEHL